MIKKSKQYNNYVNVRGQYSRLLLQINAISNSYCIFWANQQTDGLMVSLTVLPPPVTPEET